MPNSDATSHEALSAIPAPPDFPVTWQQPEDERVFWKLDSMHFPQPVTPMMGWFAQVFSEGYKRASQASQRPIRLELRRINTYFYNGVVPMAPPEEMEGLEKRAEEKQRLDMARLWEWWDKELLPEVKEHLAFWEAFDLRGATMPALLTHLEDTQARLTRLWEIHFLVAFPFLLGPSMFEELYRDLFGKDGALDAYRLLRGFGNKTVEGGHALWELSRKALASPQVRRALEENGPAAVPAALEGSSEGRSFLGELRGYLEEYGWRSDIFGELGDPHWIENPATPIKNLKDFISQPNRDLGAELEALAAERETLIAEARERLRGHPRRVAEQFEFLLQAGQAGTVIQEDHNHWIDQRGTYAVRRVLLEFGRRFAEAGVSERPDDVFYLTAEELRETASALPRGDRRQLVVERKAEMDHFHAIQPPPALGTPPPGPPPGDPMSSAVGRFFGAPPRASTEADILLGTAASPGKARGAARVVLSLAEAGKLQPGDILVAPTTMPAWTPLFASIAALVAETGGVLSHGAIVAREYNIPAVVGAANATAVIEDGQTLEVDGDAGAVRIVRSP